ncbi:hypothetical protein [Aquitalea pelogenes]|uniref:hypothetical protein n=1 Tax=Aquitalea pelogenes TaxID=1293573 RepID=UPI0035B1B9DC
MKELERNIDYLIGKIDGNLSLHIGRGYLKENGKYKQTLSIPSNIHNPSSELHEQLSQFQVIYAIDSNSKTINGQEIVASCAVHISLKYSGNSIWETGEFTRLPVAISIATESNPEPFAWRRLIEYLSPKIPGNIAIVVDSELGSIPLYNSRSKPICDDFTLPPNTQLIYASSDRDLSSPLNKAISICDSDATKILEIISRNIIKFKTEDIPKIPYGAIFIPPKM